MNYYQLNALGGALFGNNLHYQTIPGRQVVTCSGGYSYYAPANVELEIDDVVLLPANYRYPASESIVTRIGGVYVGELATIIRLVHRPERSAVARAVARALPVLTPPTKENIAEEAEQVTKQAEEAPPPRKKSDAYHPDHPFSRETQAALDQLARPFWDLAIAKVEQQILDELLDEQRHAPLARVPLRRPPSK